MKGLSTHVLVLSLVLVGCSQITAQSWKAAKYDTAWLPTTQAQLQTAIRQNANDSTALYQLWRRARYQKLAQVAFDTFKALKSAQPNNAHLLATYCMIIEQHVSDDNKPRFSASKQDLDVQTRRANIERAKKLNPKLWLVYAAQGRFEYNTTIFDVDDQVRIYKKALRLAPNLSFTNNDYSNALTDQSLQKKQPYTSAISYKMKAQKLAPITCEPALGLIMMYRWRVPNTTKEKQAAQDYLATIPPNLKLTPERRKWLAQWGVKVPW